MKDKKRKMIIVSRDFFPTSNATTTCLNNLINELTKYYAVTLFTKYDFLLSKKIRGVKLIRPKAFSMFFLNALFQIDRKFKSKVKMFRICTYINSLCQNKLLEYNQKFLYEWQDNIVQFIERYLDRNNVELILSIGAPFENIEVSAKIKKRYSGIKMVTIYFDLYFNNPECINIDSENRYTKELEWNHLSDEIFTLEVMKSNIVGNEIPEINEKLVTINLPLLVNKCSNNSSNGHKIVIVYTGMFYEEIRNPAYSFKVWQEVLNINPNIVIEIYGFGCQEIVENFRSSNPNKVYSYGHVSKKKIDHAVERADFLWNLGNSTVTQIPSKLIEYFSYGKPIISFVSNNNDPTIDLINKYSSSHLVNLNEKNILIIAESLSEFISLNKNKRINFDVLSKELYEFTPEAVALKIKGEVERHEKESFNST